jgi:hypothetical protein
MQIMFKYVLYKPHRLQVEVCTFVPLIFIVQINACVLYPTFSTFTMQLTSVKFGVNVILLQFTLDS